MKSTGIHDDRQAKHDTEFVAEGLSRLAIILARQAAADHVSAMLAAQAATGYRPQMDVGEGS